jgi:hypothetical protein
MLAFLVADGHPLPSSALPKTLRQQLHRVQAIVASRIDTNGQMI